MRWVRRWLTGGHTIQDYVPVALAAHELRHSATLSFAGRSLDVTHGHWTLGYAPVTVGIALPEPVAAALLADRPLARLTVHGEGGTPLSTLTLRPTRVLAAGVLGFLAESPDVRCLDPLRRAFLLRRLQRAGVRRGRTFGALTPRVYRQYAALFCYPRRVVLLCTPGGRVFPIDLHGLNPETGAAVLGVRQSSAAVAELLDTRALALCDVAGHHRPDVYALGKMGGQPTAAAMAGGRRTRHFGIAVPDIAAGWTEVRVTHDVELGVQRLLAGEVVGGETTPVAALHHLHLVAWLAMAERYREV